MGKGSTDAQIAAIIESKANAVYDRMEKKLLKFCEQVCAQAVNFRLSTPNAHDFTGNLLGSIAVALYRKGRLIHAVYSADDVKAPTHTKMTHPHSYFFVVDYSGEKHTAYKATVKTDEGYGPNDAESFVVYYEPNPNAIFEIVCAYTTEYATWVEMERQTTGYVNMVKFMEINTVKAVS